MLLFFETTECDCADVGGLSGGLAGVQRACFFASPWVLPIGITLMQPEACTTRMPSKPSNHMCDAAEAMPSLGRLRETHSTSSQLGWAVQQSHTV